MKCSIRKSISLIAVICIILNVLCSCGKDTGDIRSDSHAIASSVFGAINLPGFEFLIC